MWVYGLEFRSLGQAATAFSHWAVSLVLYMLCLKTLCCIAFVVEFISIWNHLVYIEHQEKTVAPGSCVTFALWVVTFAHMSCMYGMYDMSLPCSVHAPFKGALVRSFKHLCFKIVWQDEGGDVEIHINNTKFRECLGLRNRTKSFTKPLRSW